VQIKTTRRTVSTRYPRLRADCTYRADITFRRLPRAPLRAGARFFGNRAVKGISARTVRIR
jgi:hypothetical protein